MELLKERIRKDGVVKEGNVLKVDRFLNHQMDVSLFREIGKEFKRRFEGRTLQHRSYGFHLHYNLLLQHTPKCSFHPGAQRIMSD